MVSVLCAVAEGHILVLARLMTLDIHVACPLNPASCFPLPLLLPSASPLENLDKNILPSASQRPGT
jgi:hypothetical protein